LYTSEQLEGEGVVQVFSIFSDFRPPLFRKLRLTSVDNGRTEQGRKCAPFV
jgi:hypothetical protein